MSNSPLVQYTKISPHKTTGRNHIVDTITIHHMAGNLSIETCGNVFQSREASSNYGVDSKGRIGMYVEEKDRSWCSSSSSNDNRAITIEVANSNKKWEISSQAMVSLINLVVDCCRRNNISKLVWSELKADRINHKNGCNMTVHRDFASTTCPGDYLYSKMPYIASEVNKQLIPFNEEGVGEFVERLYQTTLGRSSDPAGKTYWIDKARCGATGADLAYGFLRSPEFLRLSSDMTDEEYVETLYQAFFGRRSDPIGLNYWCGRLEAGYDRDSIIKGFIGSVEWRDLCRLYGIKPQ